MDGVSLPFYLCLYLNLCFLFCFLKCIFNEIFYSVMKKMQSRPAYGFLKCQLQTNDFFPMFVIAKKKARTLAKIATGYTYSSEKSIEYI